MTTHALFPGSFDPVHNGHIDVLHGALEVFDQVTIAAFDAAKRNAMFELPQRVELLQNVVNDLDVPKGKSIAVASFDSLVADFAREIGATALVRGLRVVSDFEAELQMAQMNKHLSDIQTVFIPTSATTSFLASHLIREVARFGGDVSGMVPPAVDAEIEAKSAGGA